MQPITNTSYEGFHIVIQSQSSSIRLNSTRYYNAFYYVHLQSCLLHMVIISTVNITEEDNHQHSGKQQLTLSAVTFSLALTSQLMRPTVIYLKMFIIKITFLDINRLRILFCMVSTVFPIHEFPLHSVIQVVV